MITPQIPEIAEIAQTALIGNLNNDRIMHVHQYFNTI